jgi:predicted amidophosphoribosyltransferase
MKYLIINHNIIRQIETDKSILIPIPSHRSKVNIRGFNQAEIIGSTLSEILHIPIFNDILIKTKSTKSSVLLTKQERNTKQNFFDVNYSKFSSLKGINQVILVDDVVTAGTTLRGVAQVLNNLSIQKNLPFRISAICLFRGKAHWKQNS